MEPYLSRAGTAIFNLGVMPSQACRKTRTEAFGDRQVLRKFTSFFFPFLKGGGGGGVVGGWWWWRKFTCLHILFRKLFEKALYRAIQGMQRMRLYLKMAWAGAGAGTPGQGRGLLRAGVQTPGGVCSPEAFFFFFF